MRWSSPYGANTPRSGPVSVTRTNPGESRTTRVTTVANSTFGDVRKRGSTAGGTG